MTRGAVHLTEDEIDEALIGTAPPERMAHLRDCVLCSSQLTEFRAAMASFNQAASAWSESRSNALTRDLQQHRTPFRVTARAAWCCASLTVLAAALGLGLYRPSVQIAASPAELRGSSPAAASSSEPVQPGIASDDAMLRQIDAAIDTAEPSPEDLYGIADTSSTSRRSAHPAQVRD